jgi:hypothetical protein
VDLEPDVYTKKLFFLVHFPINVLKGGASFFGTQLI